VIVNVAFNFSHDHGKSERQIVVLVNRMEKKQVCNTQYSPLSLLFIHVCRYTLFIAALTL